MGVGNVHSKNRTKKNNRGNKGKGVCLWNRIELLFDVSKQGVGNRKLCKLDLRILAARRELHALKRRGIEGVELLDILNREGSARRVGPTEITRHESELEAAFKTVAANRDETHTIEVPRWIMEALSAGKMTVVRALTLLFYLYRRLVKSKSHATNWISVGEAYGRFKLADLREMCGIHLSRASEAIKWLRSLNFLTKAKIPFWERMKRGACYTDGSRMKENGNNFGRNRKPAHSNPKNQKTYTETNKESSIFELRTDQFGNLVASRR